MNEPNAVEALRAQLRRYALSGEFRPGERLGSERGLAETFGVPRTQLRRVLDDMEARGEIQRWLGRTGGVFLNNQRIQRHLNTVEGVPDMVRQQGLAIETTVCEAIRDRSSAAEQRNLQLRADQDVYRVTRLRLVDGLAWSLDHSALPAHHFGGLLKADLTGSLYGILRLNYGVEPDHADEEIEVVSATASQADMLGVRAGDPLFEIWRVAYDDADRPIEFAHDFFRADRTRIHMQKYGTNWKRARRGDESGRA